MVIHTINPATEEKIKEYQTLNSSQIDSLIEAGQVSFKVWRTTSFATRKKLMLVLADLLDKQKQELALIITTEMGKPISSSLSEIEKCALLCRHYAENAETYLQERLIQTEMQKTLVCYEPLGLIFAVMPWNFPFWQVFRFAIPTIMAGNGAILKHASVSLGAGQKIAELFLEAGFPEHLFQNFTIEAEKASQVITHKHVAAVTLTGSGKAGESVAATAGKYLKKSVLELGGSDPYLVLEDADLSLAAKTIIQSRLNNCGQVCIAAKRVIALNSIYEELINEIEKGLKEYKYGDPLKPETILGPMARYDLRETLHAQVLASMQLGAKLRQGGKIPNMKGFYYPATLLIDVKKGMPAFDEELFGPVVAVTSALDEGEAIQLANDSPYGLGAAVFTKDLKRGEDIARFKLEAGSCFVNALVASDPRVPFGGIKQSGFGRELSKEGIHEFVNVKTVSIQ